MIAMAHPDVCGGCLALAALCWLCIIAVLIARGDLEP